MSSIIDRLDYLIRHEAGVYNAPTIRDARAEIERLEADLADMPRTKDGQIIKIGMTVYARATSRADSLIDTLTVCGLTDGVCMLTDAAAKIRTALYEELYSTREAAEAAGGGKP